MKITKDAVIQAASDIADEKGLNNVSLKIVAEKLNIKTPSLYNHIDCLEDLFIVQNPYYFYHQFQSSFSQPDFDEPYMTGNSS